jgi:hypothetical protein
VRRRFESGWNVVLPLTTGLDNHEMVEAIHEGKLKAMYLCGEEMSIVDSNANYVSAAFGKLDFFMVQDMFFSATASSLTWYFRLVQVLKKKVPSPAPKDASNGSTKSSNRSKAAGRTGKSCSK